MSTDSLRSMSGAALLLALTACSSSSSSSGAPANPAQPDAGDAAATSVPCEEHGGLDLTGAWAAKARFSLSLRSQTGGVVTVCPAGQAALAEMLLLIRVENTVSAASPSLTAWPCSLALPSVSAVVGECHGSPDNALTTEILFPDSLLDAFPSIPVETVHGVLSGDGAGAQVAFERFHFNWGTRRADALPTWQSENPGCGQGDVAAGRSSTCESACVESCSDLADDDSDGYPAVTLHVCGTLPDDIAAQVACHATSPNEPGVTLQGTLSMALHTELELAGAARSSCEIAGTFASNTTYSVVGADAYLSNTQVAVASAIKSLPLFDAVDAQSAFRMIRVDGAHGTPDWAVDASDPVAACEVIRQRRNDLE